MVNFTVCNLHFVIFQGEVKPVESKNQWFPALYINKEKPTNAFISTGATLINCTGSRVADVIYQVMGLYYCLDSNYPECYSNLLGFIQTTCLSDTSVFAKSSKFCQFLAEFKKLRNPVE